MRNQDPCAEVSSTSTQPKTGTVVRLAKSPRCGQGRLRSTETRRWHASLSPWNPPSVPFAPSNPPSAGATRGHTATLSARARFPTSPRPPEREDRLWLPSKAYRHKPMEQRHRCTYPLAIRRPRCSLGRSIVLDAGMPRMGPTSRHSGNADGCDRHARAPLSLAGFPYPRTTPSVRQRRLVPMTNKDKSAIRNLGLTRSTTRRQAARLGSADLIRRT